MRWFSALVIAVCACDRAAAPARPAASPATQPAAPVAAPPTNTLGLQVEILDSPISEASVRLESPDVAERVAPGAARGYEVRWRTEHVDPDALNVDLALDAYRPRRLPGSVSVLPLGLLVPADAELLAGEHWLFAAPVLASGLVPRRASGQPRSAVARKFWIADSQPGPASASGVVWFREPQGTYNGSSSERVVFDAHVFSANGAAISAPCAIRVQGSAAGDLRLPAPFAVLGLQSGDYDLSGFAAGTGQSSARFTVNRELGERK